MTAGSTDELTVVVVDDQQVMREGLTALLNLMDGVRVLGDAANGEQALAVVAAEEPDVVLMDLNMPVMGGVEATRRLAERHPAVAVVVLTTYVDDDSISAALRAGAKGYLTKDAGRVEIAAALRSAAAGQSTFDAAVSARLVAAMTTPPPVRRRPVELPDGLTAREAEVLGLIGAGRTNAEIAAALFIGDATVKTHINNAFAKIGARDRSDAIAYAERHELS